MEGLHVFSSARTFEPKKRSHYACSCAVSHEGVCGCVIPTPPSASTSLLGFVAASALRVFTPQVQLVEGLLPCEDPKATIVGANCRGATYSRLLRGYFA